MQINIAYYEIKIISHQSINDFIAIAIGPFYLISYTS